MVSTRIKKLFKNILLSISPLYRMTTNMQKQLDNLREQLECMQKNIVSVPVENDNAYLHADVPLSTQFRHNNQWEKLFELGNKEGFRILEIGSREVTGERKEFVRSNLKNATYIGFDFHPGNNVDVVGDVHKLSKYFKEDEKFDIIFSTACFEHFAMPWIAAVEIAKMLKIGGYLMIETHFTFSSHERPWHFFQFSDMALKVLFSSALGFECIEAGVSNPIVGRFSSLADEYLRYKPVTGLYCHVEYFGRKINEVNNFCWEEINLNEIVGETKYPEPLKIDRE